MASSWRSLPALPSCARNLGTDGTGSLIFAETRLMELALPDQSQPVGQLTIKISAMPADTNANGDIFGGWVMARMDQAGGIAGVERAQGRVVTVKVDTMNFIRPMKVGDVLCVYSSIGEIGRTSMKIHIEAWAQRFRTNVMEKVTDATFTFVAVDDDGKPRMILR